MNVEQWKEEVQAQRSQKNVYFATYPESPLPAQDRPSFRGLAYWPPNPSFRFELLLHEHGEKTKSDVEDTSGRTRVFLRWGAFHFELGGKAYTLQAYKSDVEDERLFIPFRDATSGKESYGAGRYLDLEPGRHMTPEGQWILDFNQAYNPWCAYSTAYVCPFVPPENWLAVPIKAGEKTYPAAHAPVAPLTHRTFPR